MSYRSVGASELADADEDADAAAAADADADALITKATALVARKMRTRLSHTITIERFLPSFPQEECI